MLAAAAPLLGALASMTPDSADVAAVFPPWWSASSIFIAASAVGVPVRSGRLPWVLVVHGDRADLGSRLRAAGALILLDPRRVRGCGF